MFTANRLRFNVSNEPYKKVIHLPAVISDPGFPGTQGWLPFCRVSSIEHIKYCVDADDNGREIQAVTESCLGGGQIGGQHVLRSWRYCEVRSNDLYSLESLEPLNRILKHLAFESALISRWFTCLK